MKPIEPPSASSPDAAALSIDQQALDGATAAAVALAALAEHPGPVMLLDPASHRLVFANLAAQRFFGADLKRLRERPLYSLIPLPSEERLQRELTRLATSSSGYHILNEYHDVPAGQTSPATIALQRVHLPDFGNYVVWWAHFSSEYQQLEENWRRSIENYDALINNIVDGVITINESGIIQTFNAAAVRLFGYRVDEVVGQNVHILMPEPHRSAHQGYIVNYLTTGVAKIIGIGRALLAQRKDGSLFNMELTITEASAQNGRFFIGITRDITERVQMREEQQARLIAEEASKAKTAFLSTMSHELRTPLNAILGFNQLLELNIRESQARGSALPAISGALLSHVDEIASAGQHLLRLVNDILELSRIEMGNIEIHSEAVELIPLVEDCVRMMKVSVEAQGLTLSFNKENAQGMRVQADRQRLSQVLLNLLSNAVKYNRERGSIHVTLGTPAANQCRITVRDTGRGLTPREATLAFEPFKRLLRPDDPPIEGTGIGLSISRELVRLMGGTLGVDSVKGVGSEFYVDLPAASSIGSHTLAALNKPATSAASPAGRVTRVLYIEDNVTNLRLIKQVLSDGDSYQLECAITASAGLAAARLSPPDVILLDLNLNGVDGYEVFAELRADPLLRQVPVIALTAQAMPWEVERGLQAGFHAYITKPVNVAYLLEQINLAVKSRATGRDR